MNPQPHILLIGNYLPDGGESMDRYAAMLARHLPVLGFKISFLLPPVIAGRFSGGSAALAKFLGYVDKLVLFPWKLRRFLARSAMEHPVDLVHVCDNCNAFYVTEVQRHSPRPVALVTCHDFFALNGMLGLSPGVRPRLTGRLLQRHVLRHLRRADHLLCVSPATAENLLRLPGCAQAESTTIANGWAENFGPLPALAADERVGALHPALRSKPRGYILHVGNNLWYKNRKFVLEAYFEACRRLSDPPALVLAGKKLEGELAAQLAARPENANVLELGRVDDAQLAALYTNASCLFFPSLAEGFGWPILEAMACGCPVITSNRSPMADIAGGAAVLVDPTAISEAADALARIARLPVTERNQMVAAGLKRTAQYSMQQMLEAVAQLYRRLLECSAGIDGPPGREPSSKAGVAN